MAMTGIATTIQAARSIAAYSNFTLTVASPMAAKKDASVGYTRGKTNVIVTSLTL